VKIEVIDSDGYLVTRDSIQLKLSLSGAGELAASGNANPKDMSSVNRPDIKTYRGLAQAIIRPSGSGNVKLVVESRGLKTGELIIQVTERE